MRTLRYDSLIQLSIDSLLDILFDYLLMENELQSIMEDDMDKYLYYDLIENYNININKIKNELILKSIMKNDYNF